MANSQFIAVVIVLLIASAYVVSAHGYECDQW
jgi:hypothetical protein